MSADIKMTGEWANLILLVAYMYFLSVMTYLAEYIATPHEFTLAFLLNVSYSSLVTATTAQQSASIQAGTGPVTFSSSSTQNTQPAGSRTQQNQIHTN